MASLASMARQLVVGTVPCESLIAVTQFVLVLQMRWTSQSGASHTADWGAKVRRDLVIE